MEPTDDELYSLLLKRLARRGDVVEGPGRHVVQLRGFPAQDVSPIRLHLAPEVLGPFVRDRATEYVDPFSALEAHEAAVIEFFVHLLLAIEKAEPGQHDLTFSASQTPDRPVAR